MQCCARGRARSRARSFEDGDPVYFSITSAGVLHRLVLRAQGADLATTTLPSAGARYRKNLSSALGPRGTGVIWSEVDEVPTDDVQVRLAVLDEALRPVEEPLTWEATWASRRQIVFCHGAYTAVWDDGNAVQLARVSTTGQLLHEVSVAESAAPIGLSLHCVEGGMMVVDQTRVTALTCR